jgi:hypothetical protein
MRIRTVSAAVTLILVGLGAAACSGGSTSTGSGASGGNAANASTKPAATSAAAPSGGTSVASAAAASGGTSAASAAAASGGTSAAAAAKGFDACAAMPLATVSHITGTTFTSTKPDSTAGVVYGCDYSGPNSSLLQVSVTTTDGKVGYDVAVSSLTTVGYPPTSVSGVGDKAWSEPDPKGNAGSLGAAAFGAYGALFGDTYIQIGGLTYVTADQGKQIVELLHSKL